MWTHGAWCRAHDAITYVGVELPHKGGEVAVLEVLGQEVPGKLWRLPHDEAAEGGGVGGGEGLHIRGLSHN